MIVLDSSVVVDFLLGRDSEASRSVMRALNMAQGLVAPELMDVEVAQVIRRYELRGEVDTASAIERVALCSELPVTRYPHRPLLRRAFAYRHRLSIYDAVYVALAEALGGVLLTGDQGVADTPGVSAVIRFAPTSA